MPPPPPPSPPFLPIPHLHIQVHISWVSISTMVFRVDFKNHDQYFLFSGVDCFYIIFFYVSGKIEQNKKDTPWYLSINKYLSTMGHTVTVHPNYPDFLLFSFIYSAFRLETKNVHGFHPQSITYGIMYHPPKFGSCIIFFAGF